MAAYRDQTGREGLARAMARLAPANDTELLTLILSGPDGAQRAAAVEILGDREDEALQATLLQACRDPLTDIADRALFHVGRLPSAETLAKKLLHSQVPEDLGLGLRMVAEHRYVSLVPDLLVLMRTANREDLMLQAIEALGAVGAAQAADPMVELLHTGQSPRLQVALAQALRDLKQPEVARILCSKAHELRQPSLHAVAVEALAGVHGASGPAMPINQAPELLDLILPAWNSRSPWALRLRLVRALQDLRLDSPDTWRILSDLVVETLTEKRPVGAWSTPELHQVQNIGREFAKRAAAH
jgi:HEAT repeat protein